MYPCIFTVESRSKKNWCHQCSCSVKQSEAVRQPISPCDVHMMRIWRGCVVMVWISRHPSLFVATVVLSLPKDHSLYHTGCHEFDNAVQYNGLLWWLMKNVPGPWNLVGLEIGLPIYGYCEHRCYTTPASSVQTKIQINVATCTRTMLVACRTVKKLVKKWK